MSGSTNKRIAELVFKYLLKSLSDDEQQELNEWIAESAGNQSRFNEMTNNARLAQKLDEYNEADREAIWRKIGNQAPAVNIPLIPRPATTRTIWFRISVAASIVLLIAAGGWYLTGGHTNDLNNNLSAVATATNDVAPGGNKAVLTLADGSTIVLDNAQNGSLARQGSTAISKQQDQLTYKAATTDATKEVLYNTLSTPRGGQYHVTLPDGSAVWLNAASSIRFPTQFIGKERRVTVKGEAYFEVAKDASKPFIVAIEAPLNPPGGGEDGQHLNTLAGRPEIRVLGTHFNVSAYADENNINTTLLEGSIQFTPNAERTTVNAVMLKPGQQAILNNNVDNAKVVTSNEADASIYWVKGIFHFEKSSLTTVMRQLSRWYDVQVVYEAAINQQTITGDVPRNVALSELLSMLEKMSNVHYSINGKTITVK